nr:hypothetical protein 3 [Pseudomonadaceae bacterium]
MTDNFSEYVRSSAFRLDLSHRMIVALLDACGLGPEDDRLNIAPYLALQRRGLLEHKSMAPTEAGRKVAELLVIAGYAKGSEVEREVNHETMD